MRIGQDRHEIGELVKAMLFPTDASARLFGLPSSSSTFVLPEGWSGPMPDGHYLAAVPDPLDSRRELRLDPQMDLGQVTNLKVRFFSDNKIDVDAAYRASKVHVDAIAGKPSREVGNVLVFSWVLPSGGRLSMSRFRVDDGRAVLLIQQFAA